MRRKLQTNRRRTKRKGAAVVEFAVVAPVLLLFMFGIIEYGRMVMVQQALTTAAREGARRAVVEGTTAEDVTTTVNTYLATSGISGTTVSVTLNSPSTVTHGDPVSVSVSVPFSQVSWLPSPFFLGNTTLSSTAIMRRETPY